MPSSTVVASGIWFGGPMQQFRWSAGSSGWYGPCQLTLQPPSWLAIAAWQAGSLLGSAATHPALGPVTTILPRFVLSGSVGLLAESSVLRSSVIDSPAALRARSR